LRSYAGRAEEQVLGTAKETRAAFDETIERGKCFSVEEAEDVEASASIGRKILRDRLDTRLSEAELRQSPRAYENC
jgi:hypothetical protein